MSFTIRRATIADAAALHSMITELADFENARDSVVATVDDLKRFGFGDEPLFNTLIAEAANAQPIGFALYVLTYSTWTGRPTLHLEDLFVRDSARGMGVGQALFTEVGLLAKQLGCRRYQWQVLDWNTPAMAFYEHQGAQKVPEWLTYRLDGEALEKLGSNNAPSGSSPPKR